MKNQLVRWVISLLSLLACVWLLKLAYSGVNFEEVLHHIKQLDVAWVCVLAVVSLTGHTVRSLRWQMLLKACNQRVAFHRVFLALLSGYFVNQALVRGGELVRCYLIRRSDNVSLGNSIGTVIAERVIDTLCLAMLMVTFFLVLGEMAYRFFEAHILGPLQQMAVNLPVLKMAILGAALLLVLVFLVWQLRKRAAETESRKGLKAILLGFADEMYRGLIAVQKVESKALFMLYTLLIWLIYFLMTYLWFFSLHETRHLGLRAALFIWVIGNIGRLVPVQGGGAGAYHYLVIQAFMLLGVSASVAGAMALVIHGLQTIIYVVPGSFSLLGYLFLIKRSPKPEATHI